MRRRELPEKPGLAHARLADDRHHLALPASSPLKRQVELDQFVVAPHKAGQAPYRSTPGVVCCTAPAPSTSYTSTGALNPFTATGPSDVPWT